MQNFIENKNTPTFELREMEGKGNSLDFLLEEILLVQKENSLGFSKVGIINDGGEEVQGLSHSVLKKVYSTCQILNHRFFNGISLPHCLSVSLLLCSSVFLFLSSFDANY